mmetsp:Transcript_14403/g.50594  ORF Transcript_14403/g.50594 Transcript_14403/m.50594 type:complete len:333 (+) Transcript_14403:542-1540(+)
MPDPHRMQRERPPAVPVLRLQLLLHMWAFDKHSVDDILHLSRDGVCARATFDDDSHLDHLHDERHRDVDFDDDAHLHVLDINEPYVDHNADNVAHRVQHFPHGQVQGNEDDDVHSDHDSDKHDHDEYVNYILQPLQHSQLGCLSRQTNLHVTYFNECENDAQRHHNQDRDCTGDFKKDTIKHRRGPSQANVQNDNPSCVDDERTNANAPANDNTPAHEHPHHGGHSDVDLDPRQHNGHRDGHDDHGLGRHLRGIGCEERRLRAACGPLGAARRLRGHPQGGRGIRARRPCGRRAGRRVALRGLRECAVYRALARQSCYRVCGHCATIAGPRG